jgi:hypothetical protein
MYGFVPLRSAHDLSVAFGRIGRNPLPAGMLVQLEFIARASNKVK